LRRSAQASQSQAIDSSPGRDAAAEAGDLGDLVPGLLDPHHERAGAGDDRVAVAQEHPLGHPQAVDDRAVGAVEVAEVAGRGVELDEEMVARQHLVVAHRDLRLRRPADHQRLVAIEVEFLPREGAGGDAQRDVHPAPSDREAVVIS
jgi:hypothetical protein